MNKKEIQKNRKEIIGLLQETERPGIEKLVSWLDHSNFFTSPASTMFHGNYEGGLAAHSYEVYQEFKQRVGHYGLLVPNDSVVISSIGHDCCKTNYYVPNLLKNGNLSESKPYKVQDNFPVGHGEKSVMLLQKFIDLTNQESAIIRWHMGPFDPSWDDYQDKVEKMFPEAVVFHHADKEISLIKQI